jgi:hypothetical protein
MAESPHHVGLRLQFLMDHLFSIMFVFLKEAELRGASTAEKSRNKSVLGNLKQKIGHLKGTIKK